jgi:hypothetical protein
MLNLHCDSLRILTLEGGYVMVSSPKGLMALIGMIDMQTGTLFFNVSFSPNLKSSVTSIHWCLIITS